MDFSRPHVLQESVATKSNIRYIEVPDEKDDNNTNDNLDNRLIRAANQAAQDLLLGPCCDYYNNKATAPPDPRRINAALYPERITPQSETIQPGDLVVIFESFDNLNFVYATRKGIFNNRNGNFHHDDFIGKPFGCKIRSRSNRGYGFVYLLKPTPELWSRSLNHRTQIVHELDASMVCFYLQLKPNMVVVETGTGSGAMSHAILRTIAPRGQLHTFEFNHARAEQARQDFAKNGLSHLVTVYHKDVCGKAPVSSMAPSSSNSSDKNKNKNKKADPTTTQQQQQQPPQQQQGGFGLPAQSVSAVFLDLPEPWLAIPHAAFCLKANGRLASYSPCVEQTQRTVVAMRKAGFHSIKTLEFRIRENYVDEVEYELPPKEKRPRPTTEPTFLVSTLGAAAAAAAAATTATLSGGEDTGAEADNEKSEMSETEADQLSLATAGTAEEMALMDAPLPAAAATTATTTAALTAGSMAAPTAVTNKTTGSTTAKTKTTSSSATNAAVTTIATETTATSNNPISSNTINATGNIAIGKRKKILVARPFVMMRGHTAFLTFATAGNTPQPDPNKQ